MLNADALAKLKTLVPRMRKAQRPWPPVREWPTLLVGVVNSEQAPNKRGLFIRSAGLWAAAGGLPADVEHVETLTVGEVRDLWLAGSDAWCRLAAPPRGVDVLVDEVRKLVEQRLAAAQPVYLSMTTTDHVQAGAEVLSAKLLGVSIMLGERPGGVPGAQAYAGERRDLSPAAARLVAEAQCRADQEMAQRWRRANDAHGWRV